MPSILPDFEYDIFISYRQNDNKYDGWVTEFVTNLQKELDATLKNPVSIYFDENPHDGLLESHTVGESLEKKLKCIVLIPIISQTYCDETCFAWEHEFIPFYNMAKDDELGLSVQLRNGNVASRILPIQIHELDPEDQNLIEGIIGPLRAIKFIYQSAGVNRPLRIKDDELGDNQNKTNYRNQINKVANALKEIGTGVLDKKDDSRTSKASPPIHRSSSAKKSYNKWVAVITLLVLIVFSFWYFQNAQSTSVVKEASIAVMPFRNDSNDENNIYFCNGLMEDIIAQLAKNKDMRVPSSTSMIYYRDNPKPIEEIVDELDVNYLLEGSVRKQEDMALINVTLIDAENNERLWSDRYEINLSVAQLWEAQQDIASEITKLMNLAITLSGTEELPTSNFEAYDLFLKGRDYYRRWDMDNNRQAVGDLRKAMQLDPSFIDAIALTTQLYGQRVELMGAGLDSAKYYAFKLEELAPDNINNIIASAYIHALHGDFQSALDLYSRADEIDPNGVANFKGWAYMNLGYDKEAFEWGYRQSKLDPKNVVYLIDIQNVTFKLGMYDVNQRISAKAIQVNPNLVWAYQEQFRIHLIEGNFDKALEVAKFSHDISSANDELIDVGTAYIHLDSLDKAEEVFLEVINKSETDGIEWDDALAKYSAAAIRLWSIYTNTNRLEEAERMKLKAQGLFDSDFPKSYRILYYQALYHAMDGEDKKSIEALEKWNFRGLALTGSLDLFKMEPLLSDIIQSPEIQQLIARHEKRIAADRAYIEETYDLDFE